MNRLEKEKNALTQEADELAESNEKLQKAKAALEKNNRSMDAELSETKSAVSNVEAFFKKSWNWWFLIPDISWLLIVETARPFLVGLKIKHGISSIHIMRIITWDLLIYLTGN